MESTPWPIFMQQWSELSITNMARDLIKNGYIDSLKILLYSDEVRGLNSRNPGWISRVASAYGSIDTINTIIDCGYPIDNECITDAAREGKADVVKLLIEKGAELDKINSAECSPLMTAVINNHIDVVECLLEFKIPKNKVERALSYALADEKIEISEILLKKYDYQGEVIDRLLASSASNGRIKSIKLLLDLGANASYYNDLPIKVASEYGLTHHNITYTKEEVKIKYIKVIKILIEHGAGFSSKEFRDFLRKALCIKETPRSREEALTILNMELVDRC